ncbi:superoxide dismutase family protein [Deinococcus altitudinis]|uniref:superoxide dismutase family protein n=1 Tax=Deinococcus altitudinis TaxID=468914 RepID=UPI003891E2A7
MKRLLSLGLLTLTGTVTAQPAPAPLSATAALLDAQGVKTGSATFTQVGTGMQISVQVSGLTPGMHGMHLHEFGRCAPGVDAPTNTIVPFGAAGGHFDPGRSGNHSTPTAADTDGHGGDLPMLMVGADGTGRLRFTTVKSSLTGMNGVLNRSLVIHAMPDDYKSDPAGMSGMRERCGVVTRTGSGNVARDYLLPGAQDFPEGVIYDAKRDLIFTGSAATGDIYAIKGATGQVGVFSRGGALGRSSALGLKLDAQNRLWVAGGAAGTVSVLSPDGAPVAVLETPKSPDAYVNDLTPAPDGNMYVTDSTRPVIYRVTPDLKLSAWLDLNTTPVRYLPGINLNGIVATADGRYLLTIQLNTGDLWRIDLKTKAVKKVMGGLTRGDGLLLDGRTLYVARNAEQVVAKVALSADYGSGNVVVQEPLRGLRYPSTLATIGTQMLVVQSQLDKLQGGTPETPFRLTRFNKF